MPYTTVVAGTSITAAWANASVRDQVLTPFATTAARDSAITAPVAGMVAYITSNDVAEGLSSRNSAGQWRQVWNLPWGYITHDTDTGSTSATGTPVDTGLSVTFTAVNNRRYGYRVSGHVLTDNAGDHVRIMLVDGGGTEKGLPSRKVYQAPSASVAEGFEFTIYEDSISGSSTRKVQVVRESGAGTAKHWASGAFPARLTVFDDGPAGAPA